LSAQSQIGTSQLTSTSSSSSSQTMTSTRRFLVHGGIGFLLTCSTSSLIFIDIRSAAYSISTCTAWREVTHLLWVDEGRPQHRNSLRNHLDFKLVLVLEVVDELLEGRVVRDLESVPKCPLGLAVLIISSILLQLVIYAPSAWQPR